MSRRVETFGARGEHSLVVARPEELAEPSTVRLPEAEPAPGLILPSGDINWGCPCLGGMATGPCGNQFRDAFSCFHYSTAEPKGGECYEKFSVMQSCMANYPELYGKDDDELSAAMEEASAAPPQSEAGSPSPDVGAPAPDAAGPSPGAAVPSSGAAGDK